MTTTTRTGTRPGARRSIVVGSSGSCDVRTTAAVVSGMHCRITELVNGQFMIEDLGSTNGTWITHPFATGRARVTAPVILPLGARVTLGTVEFPWTVDR